MKKTQISAKKRSKSPKKTPKKKPLSLFFRIFFFLFLIILLTTTYFITLLASSPRSIPFITTKIEKIISTSTNQVISIKNSQISITKTANLRIRANNIEINNSTTLPKVDIEIPIFSMIFANFNPKKFIIYDANFHINQSQDSPKNQTKNIMSPHKITNFFLNLKNNSHKNSIFEIKNSNLTIIDKNSSKNLLIKNAKIKTSYFANKLLVTFDNDLTINNISNFFLTSKCSMNKKQDLNCEIFTPNFNAKSFSWIHQDLKILENINATFAINANFAYTKSGIKSIYFNTKSTNGNFKYPNFFDEIINFKEITTSGSYQDEILKLDNIKAIFDDSNKTYQKYQINPTLKMKLQISKESQNYQINLENIAINELNKFWPHSLAKDSARSWSTARLKNGLITNASANITINQQDSTTIKANLKLKDTNITYSKKFPVVENVNADLNFDENSMNATIISADILNSKISNAKLTIPDFSSTNMHLNLQSNLTGHGSDILRHVAYKSNFAKFIKNYFNGTSTSKIDLTIPLAQEISVNNIKLSTISNIKNINNNYLQGSSKVNITKEANSPKFKLKINNEKAKIRCDFLGIYKSINENSSFSLSANAANLNHIILEDIKITSAKKDKQIIAKLEFDTDPFKITNLKLSNSNFGANNYHLNFSEKQKKLSLNAKSLNLSPIITNKHSASEGLELDFNKLQIVASKLKLANNNNFNDFYLFYDCVLGSCRDGLIRLKDQNKIFVNIELKKDNKKDYTTLKGKLFDVGKLAESLGISNLIEKGKAKITAKNISKNGKFSLNGEIEVYSDITIFENEQIKLLQQDTLYSTIKDKIFSNNKTTFKRIKIKFELIDKTLNIKSLIANNYKIGITASGTINLENKTYNLEGFILPGYTINNLFGLGDVPVIGSIANLLTGGADGGIFGIKYQYQKTSPNQPTKFTTNKLSAILPTSIQEML